MKFTTLLGAATLALGCALAHAADFESNGLELNDLWVRASVPGQVNGAGYLQITNKTAFAQKHDALMRYVAAYRETLDWMYSSPEALKMYSEWVKIPEKITERMRDEFYPTDELLPEKLLGLDAITEEAIDSKFLKAPLSKAQLKELFVYSKAFD